MPRRSLQLRRHFMLLAAYFVQYVKVRVSYRADFLIGLAASMAATVFALLFVIVLFSRIPRLAGWRFEQVIFLFGFSLVPSGAPRGPRVPGVVAFPLQRPRTEFPIYAAWRKAAPRNPLLEAALALAPGV